jgi:DNA polymerase-1
MSVLENASRVALDTETSGLNPRRDRIRLLSLLPLNGTAPKTAGVVWLVDCFQVDPRPLFPFLANKELVGHNLVFDLGFLASLGFEPGKVQDTMVLSQLAYGVRQPAGFHTLAECVRRELGQELDKSLQASDWSSALSPEQLAYAAQDVATLAPLLEALAKRSQESKQTRAAEIEFGCLLAITWLSQNGAGFDLDAWLALAATAEGEAEELRRQLDEQAPHKRGTLPGAYLWNWNSAADVKAVLAALGFPLDSTDDDALAGVNHPLTELLRLYRGARKRASTYGREWARFVEAGRLYSRWRQLGADTGRMSCSEPNLQNLPRNPAYRRCFTAPPGRLLVKADYAQIELRIAAKIAGEDRMIAAFQQGEDLHTLTASLVLGKSLAEVDKADRQLAKSINFGLLFGMGWSGFRCYAKSNYRLDLTEHQARAYRAAFFTAYPALACWHRHVRAAHAYETRTLAGRRRLFKVTEPDTFRLNSPVQGTGADGLKLALALLWERRAHCPGAFPVLAVHDEIVVEADAGQAKSAAGWVKQAMLDAMAPLIEPVPVEVETMIARTWGGD